jgi:hypothetical protein
LPVLWPWRMKIARISIPPDYAPGVILAMVGDAGGAKPF